MKIMHEQVSFAPLSLLKVKWNDIQSFTYPWHFHSEYEIVYIVKSSGTRFVGDSVEKFKEGDIVLLGSNTPHFWQSDSENNKNTRVNAIVVQFSKEFFSQQINSYPEFFHIREMLKKSSRGIHFSHKASEKIGKMLFKLLKQKDLQQTLYFIKILDYMSKTFEYKLLSGENYKAENYEGKDRLNKVMHYINTNYQNHINQKEIAEKIGMNVSAFSRYFSEKTGKKFSGFVNELRINYACKLLINNSIAVSQICFESGFENISNFNRTFRQYTGITPSEYRNKFQKITI